MVVKFPLSESDGMDAAYQMHRDLVQREARGPGDVEGAMYRLQTKYGLDYWKQWMCRYKRSASPDFFERLRQAHLSSLVNSVRRDLQALKIEEQKGAARADTPSLIAEAEALLAKIEAARMKQ